MSTAPSFDPTSTAFTASGRRRWPRRELLPCPILLPARTCPDLVGVRARRPESWKEEPGVPGAPPSRIDHAAEAGAACAVDLDPPLLPLPRARTTSSRLPHRTVSAPLYILLTHVVDLDPPRIPLVPDEEGDSKVPSKVPGYIFNSCAGSLCVQRLRDPPGLGLKFNWSMVLSPYEAFDSVYVSALIKMNNSARQHPESSHFQL